MLMMMLLLLLLLLWKGTSGIEERPSNRVATTERPIDNRSNSGLVAVYDDDGDVPLWMLMLTTHGDVPRRG